MDNFTRNSKTTLAVILYTACIKPLIWSRWNFKAAFCVHKDRDTQWFRTVKTVTINPQSKVPLLGSILDLLTASIFLILYSDIL